VDEEAQRLMPFTVERPLGGDESLTDLLNTMELNGWTLVHITQGYTREVIQMGAMPNRIAHVEPLYIFRKP
jgi:hypothetical protein